MAVNVATQWTAKNTAAWIGAGLTSFALTLATVTATTESVRAYPVIAVSPAQPLIDERIHVRASGLAPDKQITIASDTLAQDGLHWRSKGVFLSDARGTVDVDAQAPISGSYRRTDGMGLIWSALPDGEPSNANHAFFSLTDASRPVRTDFEVRDGTAMVASVSVLRRFANGNVRGWPMGGDAVGILFAPNDGKPHPGVVVIGGSDGGLSSPDTAMLLASHGFSALSVSYFGSKGLPKTLENIPMECFARAIRWMHHEPKVDGRFVAIYGESRGTEPALWTAANADGVNAVVARSPSFVLWGGVTASHLPGTAAWTLNGKPLPYIPNKITLGFAVTYIWDSIVRTPVRQSDLFDQDLRSFDATDAAAIPVERTKGPILLLAGKDDKIWPSYSMAQRIVARLRRFHHGYPDALVAYDDVGHPIPYAYLPTGGDRQHLKFAVGGTAEGTARAQADAWPRILNFLSNATRAALKSH